MTWLLLPTAGLASAIACYWATRWVLRILLQRQIFDQPTDRSSHETPTPRGGGLAVTAVAGLAWLAVALTGGAGAESYAILLLWLALAGLSFLDDMRGLPVLARLSAQALAVIVAVSLLPGEARVFQGLLSFWPDRILAALIWLWFVNLYNFMDGIDGITVVETCALGAGIAIVATMLDLRAPDPLLAVCIAGAVLGFGLWNWQPAKLFMGDVGSIGLGFVLGWMLLQLACAGQWLPALILPLYYLADASVTLIRRALHLQPVWRAHRSHYYQRAARGFGSHAAVSLRIAALNLVLVATALAGVLMPEAAVYCLGFAIAVCGLMMWYFHGIGNADGRS